MNINKHEKLLKIINAEEHKWLIDFLDSWLETYATNDDVDTDDGLDYDVVHQLFKRLKKNELSVVDYQNLVFHLYQKYCAEDD